MPDTMLPIIRQMHDAADDRERALVLLSVSDAVLMKYRHVFEAACRRARFDAGVEFVAWRRAAWHAVRGADGLHKRAEFEAVRAVFAAFAAGDGTAASGDSPSGIIARPSAAEGEGPEQ